MDYSAIDKFGIGIGLRYLNKEMYQSHFGAFITMLIWILVGIQTVIVGKEMIYKENPEVIFSERFVGSPARFDIKKETFNFAIGPQYPGNYTHFIDDSIYTVAADHVVMRKVLNETTNIYEQQWETNQLDVQPCTKNDFQVAETSDYFEKLPGVDQMNCIKNDAFFEGNFDQDIFSYIRITFKLCQNDTKCRPPKEINDILINSFVALYTGDVIVDPKKVNPFSIVGRDFFWNASPQFTKDINFYYRNIYAESDKGILFEDRSLDKATSFSYSDEQIILGESDYYFSIVLRFEKFKESLYYRKYKKLGGLLAEIGGIAKALMMIGFFLCIPINKLKFYEQLSNSLFSFKQHNNSQNEDPRVDGQVLVDMIEVEQKQIQNCKGHLGFEDHIREPKINLSQEFKGQQEESLQQKSNQHFENPYSMDQIILNLVRNPNQGREEFASSQIPLERIGLESKQEANSIYPSSNKLVSPKNSSQRGLNLISLVKMKNLLKKKRKVTQPEQELSPMNQNVQIVSLQNNNSETYNSIQKIYGVEQKETNLNLKKNVNQVDTINNVRQSELKLTELEKEMDRKDKNSDILDFKWIDYVKYYLWPFGEFKMRKKQIEYSMEKIYEHLDMMYIVKKLLELEKLKQLILDEDQRKLIQFLPRPTIDVEEIDKQKYASQSPNGRYKINLLTDLNILNEGEKAKQAFQALRTILQKEQLSDIDKNIIKMLDVNFIQTIENKLLKEIDCVDEENQYETIFQGTLPTKNMKNTNIVQQKLTPQQNDQEEIILSIQENNSIEDKGIIDENDLQNGNSMNKCIQITSTIPTFQIQRKFQQSSQTNEQPDRIHK